MLSRPQVLFFDVNETLLALSDQMRHAELTQYFEDLLSVAAVGRFKPDRGVYDWAVEGVGCRPEECMLVAAHGWDVAGAGWAGLGTAFVARPGQVKYPLAEASDLEVSDLSDLVRQLARLA